MWFTNLIDTVIPSLSRNTAESSMTMLQAGGFPLGWEVCRGSSWGAVPASTGLTTINSGTAPNTKGSWTVLANASATTTDVCWMGVQSYQFGMNAGTYSNSWAFDIGIGTSGSQQVVVNNLINSGSTGSQCIIRGEFPISIPANTSIWARSQSGTGNVTSGLVGIHLYDGAFTEMEGAAGVDSIGWNGSLSQSTQLTPGTATNTLGSYVQLTASTTRDYMGIFIISECFMNNGTGAGQQFGYQYLVDVAIGASGAEQVILSKFWFIRNGGWMGPSTSGFVPIQIPAGTRIAARSQCSSVAAGFKEFGIVAYGVYQ